MKAYEVDDPLELVGVGLPDGDPEQLIRSVVLEYLLLGWNEKQVKLLFTKPFFAGTHRISQERGEGYVMDIVETVCREWAQGWENARKGTAHA